MEHMAGVRDKLSGVIVTMSSGVALMDAMKCWSFTQAVQLPVLGLIENMSGYVCPCCGEVINAFSVGGGQEMARREGLRFLGSLPVDSGLVDVLDSGGREQEQEQEGGFVCCWTSIGRQGRLRYFPGWLQTFSKLFRDAVNVNCLFI